MYEYKQFWAIIEKLRKVGDQKEAYFSVGLS